MRKGDALGTWRWTLWVHGGGRFGSFLGRRCIFLFKDSSVLHCVLCLMLVLWSHACLLISCLSSGLMLVLWSHACLMVSCLSYGLMLVLWSHACLVISSSMMAKSSMTPKSWAQGPWAHGPLGSEALGPMGT